MGMQGLGLQCRRLGFWSWPFSVLWSTLGHLSKMVQAYLLGQVLIIRGSEPDSVLAQSAH